MNVIIKMICFKILALIIFINHLNSHPIILVQIHNDDQFNIKREIPMLVLGKIKSKFPNFEVDNDSFYKDSKWSILQEWEEEPPAQLYMLNLLIKTESKSNTSEKIDLMIHIYRYELTINYKLKLDPAVELMNNNPTILPLILKFSFNKENKNIVQAERKDINSWIKEYETSQKASKKQKLKIGDPNFIPPKDKIQIEVDSADEQRISCGKYYDIIEFSMSELHSFLSLKKINLKEFQATFKNTDKVLKSNMKKMNKCLVELKICKSNLEEHKAKLKPDVSDHEDFLLVLIDRAESKVDSLLSNTLTKFVLWEKFDAGIKFVLIDSLDKIKRNVEKNEDRQKIINNELILWLGSQAPILFGVNYSADVPFLSPRVLKESLSSDDDVDLIDLSETNDIPPYVPSRVPVESIPYMNNLIEKSKILMIKFENEKSNLYDWINNIYLPENRETKLNIKRGEQYNEYYEEMFTKFYQSELIIKESIDSLTKLDMTLQTYQIYTSVDIKSTRDKIYIVLGCPWIDYLKLMGNLLGILNIHNIYTDVDISEAKEKIKFLHNYFQLEMNVNFNLDIVSEEDEQQGAWGGSKEAETSKDNWNTKDLKNSFSSLEDFLSN